MEHPNENLFHYLRWRGDLTFAADPLNEADALAFATFSYLDYSAVPDGSDLKHAAPLVKQVMPSPRPSLTGRLDALLEASETARFGPVTVSHYRAIHDEEAGMQFAALCFRLPGGGIVLAYRGTDDTLIGWEEDCRISYAPVIPAQKQAAYYAREVCDCYPREPVWITGHSKGGNLAVFAGAYLYARQQKRLAAVFNNDGPGFSPQFLACSGYHAVAPKVRKFLPESSIVGAFLESGTTCRIIESSAVAVNQHDPLTWQICGNHLVAAPERSSFGRHSDAVIDAWLDTLSAEERKKLTELVFTVLHASDNRTLADIKNTPLWENLSSMARTYAGLGKEQRQFFDDVVKRLLVQVKEEAVHGRKKKTVRLRLLKKTEKDRSSAE